MGNSQQRSTARFGLPEVKMGHRYRRPCEGMAPTVSVSAQLRVARRDLLKEVASSTKKRLDQGLVEGDLFYELMSDLLEAELDLEINPEQRIAIAAANVENLKMNESTFETKEKGGVASREDVLKSRAAHLQAEIRLAEEEFRQQTRGQE